MFDEYRIFASGDTTTVITVGGHRIGLAICEDIWQDGGPVKNLEDENIDLLVTLNGSPYEEGKRQQRIDLAAQRAAALGAPWCMRTK